jgi:hypothetical protein
VTDPRQDPDAGSGDDPSRIREPSHADPLEGQRRRPAKPVGHPIARRWPLGRAARGPAGEDPDEPGAGPSREGRAESPAPRIMMDPRVATSPTTSLPDIPR